MTWDINGGYGYWINGTHNLLSSPQNFLYSGWRWYDAGGVAYIGRLGYWWSSAVNSSRSAYPLQVNSGSVFPRNSSDRNFGFTVRCIAR